ncbi:MAG: metal-dependent transcriptional regulator [Treponema sp.]|nr:metal-dependent transcriptional regulator [Treponema sp.]
MHESGEDYLEAILVLQKKNGAARSVDVAKHLKVSKPSVSRAMSVLEETGYVTVGDTSFLQLTAKGKAKANEIYSRHVLLTQFLQKITGVDAEQAEENACRIEHDIDSDVKKGIERWMKENS